MVARWHDLGHPPFADLYECFVLLAWCVALVSMTLEIAGGVRFLGGLSSLAAAGLLVAGLRFVGEARPLPPALRSPYFAPHVVSYFVAYGALTVAALAAVLLIVARAMRKTGPGPIFPGLETWVGRAGRIGFPFLTLGLVLGAFWGQAAWGDWWSWDPKEVWALITWLLVAAWFHLWRRGSRGPAVLALLVVAVGAMYFTLFGVNYLPTAEQSIHLYATP
jgi:ABC-type transport system involved in cytochrome c biogenesis permease subunit